MTTFAWYAVRGSIVEDHPPKQFAVRHILLRPRSPQSAAPAALVSAYPRLVENLAFSILPLLQPTVTSCKPRNKTRPYYRSPKSPNRLQTRAVCIIWISPSFEVGYLSGFRVQIDN